MNQTQLDAIAHLSDEDIDEDTAGIILTSLLEDINATPTPPDETDEPIVAFELLQQRIRAYTQSGVPITKAIEITLEDAIESIEIAAEHDFSREIGGLTERT